MIQDLIFYLGLAIIFFILFKSRVDILFFVFTALFVFLFIIIPMIVIYFDRKDIIYARESIRTAFLFLIGLISTYYIFIPKNKRLIDVFIKNMRVIKIYSGLSFYLVLFGILLKIVGGDIVHSSIVKIPWSFSFLYGMSDRIYYFGVMLTVVNIYFFGFSNRNKKIALIVLCLGIFGGSRVTILLPLSFFIILHSSLKGMKTMLKMAFIGSFALIFTVTFIGMYRIDAVDRVFTSEDMIDLFLFRISEFYWPVSFIEIINSKSFGYQFNWIFSGLFGAFPSFISELFLGYSIFARDTETMLLAGLGSIYMSVPMTPIGEGYYWLGDFGILLIGVIYGLGFALLLRILINLNPVISILVLVQMYRLAFTLPVAAYAEFISFVTKDVIFSIFLSKVLVSIHNSLLRRNTKSVKI